MVNCESSYFCDPTGTDTRFRAFWTVKDLYCHWYD